MRIESMKADISDKERKQIIQQMTGQKLDGTVDYKAFEMMVDSDIVALIKRGQAREEILEYMLEQIKKEFRISDNNEALLKWDEYKARHGINIKKKTKKPKYKVSTKAHLKPSHITYGVIAPKVNVEHEQVHYQIAENVVIEIGNLTNKEVCSIPIKAELLTKGKSQLPKKKVQIKKDKERRNIHKSEH